MRKWFILLGIFLLVFLNSCVSQEKEISKGLIEGTEEAQAPSTIPSEGLGNLCSSEKECISFCQNNRERCEDYCRWNENELCRIIFPNEQPEMQAPMQTPSPTATVQPSCKSDTSPTFTTAFTDLSKIRQITPIGNINAGSSSRSYVFVNTHENGSRVSAPLYAPTDATLFMIVYAYRGDKLKGARAEYRLEFRVSCEVEFGFDHVVQISDRMKQFAPTTPADTTRDSDEISVSIKEGEFLGYIEGGDFFLFNYAKKVPHINPSRWTSDHNNYADCPYDYFTAELKARYYSMFASAGGEKSQNPTCRSTSRDVAGTLSGGWFIGNSTDMKGSRLLVGSDYSIVDLIIDRDNQPRFRTREYNPSKKPEDTRPGNVLCYSGDGTYAYIKLVSDNEMRAAVGSGSCPSSFPAEYETWAR